MYNFFLALNLLIGKSNFCSAFSPGKDVYSANMIITCSIRLNGFKNFFPHKFPKYEEQDYMDSHFNRIYKKSEKMNGKV